MTTPITIADPSTAFMRALTDRGIRFEGPSEESDAITVDRDDIARAPRDGSECEPCRTGAGVHTPATEERFGPSSRYADGFPRWRGVCAECATYADPDASW